MASTGSSKRTILITGCSDGSLGSHLALAFHKAGWQVFASARNLSKLKSVEIAGIETLQLDTLSDASILSCVFQVEKLIGGSLDTLLNNAGAGYSMPLMDLDLAKARDLFDLNVFSLISTTRAFFPLLMKSPKTNVGVRSGMVVNNTSCAGLTPGALLFAGAYNASKGAAVIITENMRLELAPFGIKVVNLVTGGNVAKNAIERAMSGVDNTAEGSDPVKWAAQVVQSLSKDNSAHWIYTGKWSTTVKLASFLPVGFMDSIIKSKVGLDVLEQRLREQAVKLKVS